MVRMLCRFVLGALTVAAVQLHIAPAQAEKRVALVIGNSQYDNIGALTNPTSDGRLIAKTLEALNFETTVVLDAGQIAMKRAIAQFGRRLRIEGQEAVGLFYYAGHGIQSGGRNYLMPIEADPQDAADLDLVGVEANWVLRQMESAGNSTNIVILDACRNNPLTKTHRNVSRGLARIDAPTGSFIAYATAPGATAVDGDGANSPFTAALATALQKPGKPIEQVFKEVRIDVIRATNGRQTPWDSSSLVNDFYFVPAKAEPPPPPPPPPVVSASRGGVAPTPVELSLWKSVSESGDPSRLALFLQIYPNSNFAPEAQALMTKALTSDPSRLMRSPDRSAPAPSEASPVEQPPPKVAVARPAPPEPKAAPRPAPEPAPEAAPEPAPEPALSQQEMIEAAMAANKPEGYRAYLAAYPNGIFVDLAKAELANLGAAAAKPAAAPAPKPRAAPKPPPQSAPPQQLAALVYDRPLKASSGIVDGKSIRELAQGTPAFPPVEGLPPSYWQGQSCANCHNWSAENLCKQAQFYKGADTAMLTRKQHPYGGEFKTALRAWAQNDCK